MTKAYAVNRIQRGKDAEPRIIAAGGIFDATEAELLHLAPIGAVRKPTKEELAVDSWDRAEQGDAADRNGARAIVERMFSEPEPVKAARSRPAETAAAESASTEVVKATGKPKAEKTAAGAKGDDGLGLD